MPYNRSRAVVKRMARYLEDMTNAKRTITWPVENPKVFAYRIREAIHAAQFYPDFSRFHTLRDFYRIHVAPGFVEAEYLGIETQDIAPYAPTALTVPEAREVHAVVGACIKFGAKANELIFPSAVLAETELIALHNWGEQEIPKWRVIAHEEAGVTMTRRRDIDPNVLWNPPKDDHDSAKGAPDEH